MMSLRSIDFGAVAEVVTANLVDAARANSLRSVRDDLEVSVI